jgi:FkbM family methyltransferase
MDSEDVGHATLRHRPSRLELTTLGQEVDILQFSPALSDGSTVLDRLEAIAASMRLYDPGSPYSPSTHDTLHDNIVQFIVFLTNLASRDRDPSRDSPEMVLIIGKAHEHSTYLAEKCEEWGVSRPQAWIGGIAIRKQRSSLLSSLRRVALDKGRTRTDEATIVLGNAVRELIDHFFTICVIEIPRDRSQTGQTTDRLKPYETVAANDIENAVLRVHEFTADIRRQEELAAGRVREFEAGFRQREEEAVARIVEHEADIRRREALLERRLIDFEADVRRREAEAEFRLGEYAKAVSGRMDEHASRLRVAEVARLKGLAGFEKVIQPIHVPNLVELPKENEGHRNVQSWYLPNPELWVTAPFGIELLPKQTKLTGEVSGFVAGIEGHGRLRDNDVVVYRISLDVTSIWDEDFATILAATINVDNQSAVSEIRVGLGDDGGLAYERACTPVGSDHFASGGWRFQNRPKNPYLQIRIILRETTAPIRVTAKRLFAGQDYDPYAFNPRYESAAEREGQLSVACGPDVLRDFERKARLACRTDTYLAAQAFIRPFLVMREGTPRFPMLIGSVNSIYWYGLEPQHTLEIFKELDCLSEGDVTLDCGAHAGQMAAYFSLLAGPSGRVIAFDPFAQNCLQVEAQDSLNGKGRIRAVKAGVGAKRHTVRVSILAQMTTTTDASTPEDFTDIDIVPLDDFIDEHPTFIKLDVEGAEVDALSGAAELLRRCTPKLFIEVHTQLIGQFGYDLTAFFSKIPLDLYDVKFLVEGVDVAWRMYEPGMEVGVTTPLLVLATAKKAAE